MKNETTDESTQTIPPPLTTKEAIAYLGQWKQKSGGTTVLLAMREETRLRKNISSNCTKTSLVIKRQSSQQF